jgi:CO/xanthine dehydrogenase FAD-binding subunit
MAGVVPDRPRRGGTDASAVRIALGSVAPTVVRARHTEAVLAGGGTLADAQRALVSEISPIDDIRSTAEYRRRVAANLLAACLSGRG